MSITKLTHGNPIITFNKYAIIRTLIYEIIMDMIIVTAGSAPNNKAIYEMGTLAIITKETIIMKFLILPVAKEVAIRGPLTQSIKPLIRANFVKMTV